MDSDTNGPEQDGCKPFMLFILDCSCARCGIEPSDDDKAIWEYLPRCVNVNDYSEEDLAQAFDIASAKRLKSLGWQVVGDVRNVLCPNCACYRLVSGT